MMISVFVTMLLLAGSGNDCDCADQSMRNALEQTENLVIHRHKFVVPLDPTGKARKAACVRLKFSIDRDGVPNAVTLDKSSGDRAIDVAAMRTVEKYRFKSPPNVADYHFLIFKNPPEGRPSD